MNNGLIKKGSADGILAASRCHRVKAQGTEYIPGTHLPAIFVTDQTIGCIGIKFLADLVDNLLCTPRLAGIIKEIGHVMTGFVAVCVLPDQPRNICLLPSGKR